MEEQFPISRIAMEFLQTSAEGEPLRFPPEGDAALQAALDALFILDIDHRPALDDLIRLAQVLETEKRSPAASALIMAKLSCDPRVPRAFGGPRETEKAKRAKARFLGRDRGVAAPVFGAEAPAGTVRASSLQEPTASPARRRRNRSPKG